MVLEARDLACTKFILRNHYELIYVGRVRYFGLYGIFCLGASWQWLELEMHSVKMRMEVEWT